MTGPIMYVAESLVGDLYPWAGCFSDEASGTDYKL